jgi:hypothetical protein
VSIVGNRLDRLELTSMARSFAWVAATVVGLGVGGFVFHFPGSFGETSWQPAAIIFGAVLGGINGLLVGLLQGLALGWMRSSGSRLMLAMGIGIGASHGLADGVPLAIGLGTVVLAGSAVLTLAFRTVMGVRDRASLTAIFLAWAAGWLVFPGRRPRSAGRPRTPSSASSPAWPGAWSRRSSAYRRSCTTSRRHRRR